MIMISAALLFFVGLQCIFLATEGGWWLLFILVSLPFFWLGVRLVTSPLRKWEHE